MTAIDWVALVIVLFAALGGAAQGFVWSGLSLAGPVTLAVAFEVAGSSLGAALGRREVGELRALDSAAGVVAGALVGLVVVWVLGAMVLQLPGQANLRRAAQRSAVLRRLNSIVPPRTLLNALGRIDPFPKLAGPPIPTEPPDPGVLRQPGVRAAAPSVVRVLGTACGLGIEGSGWVARP